MTKQKNEDIPNGCCRPAALGNGEMGQPGKKERAIRAFHKIYGEYISENLCDDIINFFNVNCCLSYDEYLITKF